MITDDELLRAYVRDKSEHAFTALVQRHLNLVYSAAVRQARSPQLAEEIAQTTFTDLARNAAKIKPGTVLIAWLYRVCRRRAIDVVRREARRRARELTASHLMAMNASISDWSQIEPLLDEALGALSESDRTAILLRFFENHSLREVGIRLGTNEDAAQKRVSRALDRLRRYLAQHRVQMGTGGLAAALSANAVQAAPAGLAAAVASMSFVAASAIPPGIATFGFNQIMSTAKAQASVTGAVAVIAATAIILQHSAMNRFRDENKTLRRQVAEWGARAQTREGTAAGDPADSARLRTEHAELLRLRGQVNALRQDLAGRRSLENELATLKMSLADEVPSGASKLIIANPYLAREAWSDKGADTPYHAFETMLWAGFGGNRERLGEVTLGSHKSLLPQESPPLRRIKGIQIVTVSGSQDRQQIGAIIEDEFYGGGFDKPPGTVQHMRFWNLVRTNDQWKVTPDQPNW